MSLLCADTTNESLSAKQLLEAIWVVFKLLSPFCDTAYEGFVRVIADCGIFMHLDEEFVLDELKQPHESTFHLLVEPIYMAHPAQ
jgi:hypothetical protein